MTPSSSPYAVFRADEWFSEVAQPIGIGQCLRISPKAYNPISCSGKKTSWTSFKKSFSNDHVQLAFV